LKNLITILTFALLQGCNPDGIGCFKPAGDQTTTTIGIDAFTEIEISSNIDVILVEDNSSILSVTAGENELAGVRTEVVDGILYLDNLNSCNWTRRYKNPVVQVPFTVLNRVTLRGSGVITNLDTLAMDQLVLSSIQGSGEFNLVVDIENLGISTNEITNFTLSGSATNLSVGAYFGDGIIFGSNLKSQNCQITHRGSNTMHLNVSGALAGTIDSFGDVLLYDQAPATIDVELNSRGQIINKF
jgi:hypothetical protein